MTYQLNPNNPSDNQRFEMLKKSLCSVGRPEDFNNIIELLTPPTICHKNTPYCPGLRIGIVGGGLAGMAAAYELRKLGASITIYDALKDRVGGRVYTYYFNKEKNLYGELGPLRIPIAHQATWHYINLLELNTEPFIEYNKNELVYVNDTRVRNNSNEIVNNIYPLYNLSPRVAHTNWNTLSDYAFNYFLNGLTSRERTQILKVLPQYSANYSYLTNISLYDNFRLLNLGQDAINMINSIGALNAAFTNLSYGEVITDSYPLAFTAPLYRVAGGNSNLPIALYQALLADTARDVYCDRKLGNVTWKSGTLVTGIENKSKEVSIIFKNQDESIRSESFDFIICAIPFTTLRSVNLNPLFTNIKMQAIRNLNYIDAHRSLLLCNRQFWEENMGLGPILGGVSNTDLLISNIIYPSEYPYFPQPNKQGVLIGSYNLNKQAISMGISNTQRQLNLIFSQVEEVHGLSKGALNSIVEESIAISWNNEDNFRGAFTAFTPGEKLQYAEAILEPEYNNRVYFAGEHTSQTHGWMQGALYSGNLAAHCLTSYLLEKCSLN